MTPLLLFASLAALLVSASAQNNVIVSGATWTDTSGNVIQAHGAGIFKVGSTFYWVGEDKSHNSALFKAVSCYKVDSRGPRYLTTGSYHFHSLPIWSIGIARMMH